MRVGIMTFLHNDNYGSTLQAWALQQVIRELGWEPEHLDYLPSAKEKITNMLRCRNHPSLLLDSIRRHRVQKNQPGAAEKSAAFRRFRKEQMVLSPVCHDRSALKAAAAECDVLLCGSDQVWSPEWLNTAYMLDFASAEQPRIAYACSLGVSTMPSPFKQEKMRACISPFTAVSVREEEGQKILNALLPETDIALMPDPVFLRSRSQWLALAGGEHSLPSKRGTLVCYFIGNSPAYWQKAHDLADTCGFTPIVIPVTSEAYGVSWEKAEGVSPQRWLALLAGAELLCTDSFHGAAFAAILGIPCCLMRRYRDQDKNSKNSRIDQLLRVLDCPSSESLLPSDHTDHRIRELREKGTAWLAQSLSKAAAAAHRGGEKHSTDPAL